MLMQRETYLEVGGFDENCFMYSDDIDLSYMVLKTGRSNYYFPETSVIHYKGESTVKDGLYMKRFREAMHFFYNKHFRVSFLFDIFMKTGAFFFSMVKKNQAVLISRKTAQYILISDDENLRRKVENLLGKKIQRVDSTMKNTINSLTYGADKNIEMIFDNNYSSFKSIIESMEQWKNTGFTFKILPKNADFIIGSNDSNDRGEVITI
jgi:GT2 family glycosyltransferase